MSTVWVIGNYTSNTSNYNDFVLYESFKERNQTVTFLPFEQITLDASNNLVFNGQVLQAPDLAVFSQPIFANPGTVFETTNKKLEKLKTFNTTTFVNDVDAHWQTCNKIYMYEKMKAATQAETPIDVGLLRYGYIVNNATQEEIDQVIESVGGFPVVAKIPLSGRGDGVFLCHNLNELTNKIAETKINYGETTLIVQEYKDLKGLMLDVRVTGKSIKTRIVLSSPYVDDFKANLDTKRSYLAGKTSPELEQLITNCMQVLSLDLARLDVFITEEGLKVCEVNSIGSILGSETASNTRVGKQIVDYCLAKHRGESI